MRNIFYFYILIFFTTLSASAQTNTGYNYNFGINLYSISQTPQVNFSQRIRPDVSRYLPGIMIKINDNQLAYRIGINFYRNKKFNFAEDDSAFVHGRYLEYSLKFGVEHDLSLDNFKPYYGADIGFLHGEFSGQEMHISDKTFNYLRIQKNGLLLSPFIGLKYTLIPRFYVSAEIAINLIFAYNRLQNNNDGIERVSHFNKGEFLLAQLSMVGLHYNFDSSN